MSASEHKGMEALGGETLRNRPCPQCGAEMAEFDRVIADGALYIWLACVKEDCTGQWLAKRSLPSRVT